MHHGPEFVVVLISLLALALGAATRGFSQRTGFPYTIAILLLGLGTGIGIKHSHGEQGLAGILHLLSAGSEISPNLIIFVFLPALVFESAFALDVYGFRRNVGAVLTLAVPALLVSTVLTAFLMVYLTSGSWGWSLSAALIFGALISATDPVAVVAILRDLGAPKRLGILIEGESLLNDGTAIVVFNLLIGLLTGAVATLHLGSATLDFLRVALGGVGIGLVLGIVITAWLSRTFNDPLVEITLTLVLAYAAMIIAEGFFHVSGVMAIVTAGLWMHAQGRTRISPEVFHFLHQFWQMLAYIANTLIFLLVGLVVAIQVDTATWRDLLLVLGAYLGIMVLRFLITFTFLPVMNRLTDRISPAQATVMSWGGLRGAVSLALALVVSQNADIPAELRGQILLATAGVVLLTIVVNGSTIGALLRRFGLDRPPVAERLAHLGARAAVLDEVSDRIRQVSRARDLRTVSWDKVEDDLHRRRACIDTEIEEADRELRGADAAERAAGYWQQVLSVERGAYWSAFGQGTLGARATRVLNKEIDVQVDLIERGECRPPETRMPELNDPASALARLLRRANIQFGSLHFEHLSLIYDLSRAESMAAEKVLAFIDGLKGVDPSRVEDLRETYRRYLRVGKERLEDLRTNLPEMTRAIETRLAKRVQLNFEREGYHELVHHGTMDEETAAPALEAVEREMKQLLLGATKVDLPETAELCRSAPLFANLDEKAIDELADLTLEQVLSAGEELFREGEKGDSMFVIARGAVHVVKEIEGREIVLDVLGGGDILGEMSLLTGEPRTATIRAATTVTVGQIKADAFHRLMEDHPQLGRGIWAAFAGREFDNHVRGLPGYAHLDHNDRMRWIGDREPKHLAGGQGMDAGGAAFAFVFMGSVRISDRTWTAPALVSLTPDARLESTTDSRVVLLDASGAGA
jgi:Na+/H+ antiporter